MDNAQPEPTETDSSTASRLLLTSLAEYWSLIEPLLLAAAPKTVCEIGIGNADFTAVLLRFCAQAHCRYTGIDPTVADSLIQRLKTPQAEFLRHPSLTVLRDLPAHDVYFVDGDHNYYTVLNELRLILRHAEHWPLIFLHDVGWPWGRRDQYCSPESVPPEFRHTYSTKLGVFPGRSELGLGGFAGETSAYQYGAAEHEGGPRNGVLTAIEDFLAEQPRAEWKLLQVPGVFGLGILCAPKKCAPEVATQFAQLETAVAPLRAYVELLERNRVNLFLTYLRQVTEMNTFQDAYNKLHQAFQQLDQHAKTLRGQYDSLHQQFDSLHKNYAALAAHSESLAASYRSLQEYSQGVQAAYDALQRQDHPEPQ